MDIKRIVGSKALQLSTDLFTRKEEEKPINWQTIQRLADIFFIYIPLTIMLVTAIAFLASPDHNKRFLLISMIHLVLLISEIQFVKRNEQGVKYIFEIFTKYCKPGPHLVPRLPGCGISKISRKRFKLDYLPRLMISKKRARYGKQFLVIDAAIYTEFGRNRESVIDAIERGTPDTAEDLTTYTDADIDSGFRSSIGGLDWGKATEQEGRDQIEKDLMKVIKSKKSSFSLGGLNVDKTVVDLKTVDLQSETLKNSFAEPDIERLHAEGAKYEAERLVKETAVVKNIRDTLVDGGFNPEKADEIAHSIYELQVSKDLQIDTGKEVVKLIRLQTGDSLVPKIVAEALTTFPLFQGLFQGKPDKEEKKRNWGDMTTEEKEQEILANFKEKNKTI